ncbi:MAG: DUF234 domain-containing protein, partial [Candidatus Aerophobetes bacterium]|nr:DUF234 domain-containing protein [Candidatus Aerophobetes bacterium]
GRWWSGKDEIDIVAYDGEGSFMFCECKWTVKRVGISVLDKLQNKANKFPEAVRKYFGFFSKAGFSKGIKDLSKKRKDILFFGY